MSLTPRDHLMRIIKIPATHAFWRNQFGFTPAKLRDICSGMADWSRFEPWFRIQPPALRAYIENAPNAYELCTLRDVYERVPGDRLADCLNELRETMIALVASGKSFPWPMIWVDDCAPKTVLTPEAEQILCHPEYMASELPSRFIRNLSYAPTEFDDDLKALVKPIFSGEFDALRDWVMRSDQGRELAEFLAVEKVS